MKINVNRGLNYLKAEDDKIYLSIGMIVKNEERFLERCILAVQKLLKQTNGELIIVDTGSTDSTVAIAKKYTDKVYYHEWNNNFSDARNETLKHAKGMWYMFIDADEIFEKTDGIAEFVLNTQQTDYDLAAYTVRNMHKRNGNQYTDALLFRVHRMHPELRFEHMIHENFALGDKRMGVKIENTLCIHYGYSDDLTKAQIRNKKKRNTVLLEKCLDENPDSIHYLLHYIREFREGEHDLKRQLSYIDHAISVAQNEYMRVVFYSQKILAYLRSGNYFLAKDALTESIESRDKPFYYSDIDSCYKIALTAYNIKDYSTVVHVYNHYSKTIEQFKQSSLDFEDIAINPQDCWTEGHIAHMKCLHAYSAYRLGDESFMQSITEKVDFAALSPMENLIPGFDFLASYCSIEHNFDIIAKLYRLLIDNDELLEIMEKRLLGYLGNEAISDAIIESFYNAFTGKETAFTSLFKALKGEGSYRDILAFDKEKIKNLTPDIIYLMVKDGEDYDAILDVLPELSRIEEYCAAAGSRYEAINEYIPSFFAEKAPPNTMAELKLFKMLCYVGVKISLLPEEELKQLFRDYCRAAYTELVNSYNPELLDEENLYLLPPVYRFAIAINQAEQLQQADKMVETIRKLREALLIQEEHAKDIELWMNDIIKDRDAKEEESVAEQKEFNRLADTLIEQAKMFIEQGKKQEASLIAEQLSVLMPDNKDVKELIEKLNK